MATKAQAQGLGEFGSLGFTLLEPDDHTVELNHDGDFVARFSQVGATGESMQAECARHMVLKHGWDDASWKAAK